MALYACASFSTALPNSKHNHRSASLLSNPSQKVTDFPFSSYRPVTISQRRRLITIYATSSFPGIGSSAVGENTTDSLDKVRVFDLNGNGIPITDLWKNRKAVVAFARHFGCVLCRKRADYLTTKKEQMDAAGVALVLIGPGSVDQAKAFSQQTKFRGEVYADPSHSSYEALRFSFGVSTTFTPKLIRPVVDDR